MRSEKEKLQRLEFIDKLVDYNRGNPNHIWSKEHADFINSVFETANQDKRLFLATHKD